MSMQQAREAIARYNAQQYAPRGSEWDSFYEPIQEHNDKEMIADALTDPTPLTVERLVERGGKTADGIIFDLSCGVSVNTLLDSWTWYFTESVTGNADETVIIDHRIAPRTIGQLAMLEILMEGR